MPMNGGKGPSEPEELEIVGDCCQKLQERWAELANSFMDKIYELSLDHWACSAKIAKVELLLSLKERELQMNKLKNDSLENAILAVVEKLQRSNAEKDEKIAQLSSKLDLLRKSTPGNKSGGGLDRQLRPRDKRGQVMAKDTLKVVRERKKAKKGFNFEAA